MQGPELTPWAALGPEEQLSLRVAYQGELDAVPATCSLDAKIARFAAWLATRGIAFTEADLSRR